MTQLMINKQSGYVGALTSIILILGHDYDSSPQMAEYNEDFTTRYLLGSHVTHTIHSFHHPLHVGIHIYTIFHATTL